jgi:hypothetical protein
MKKNNKKVKDNKTAPFNGAAFIIGDYLLGSTRA